jgi:prevent-host-death family protein
MGKIKSIGMAEARPNLTKIVEDVSLGGDPYLIVSGSKIKAVLIGIEQYNDMVERLEDLSDAAELLEAESQQEATMSFEEHLGHSKVVSKRKSEGLKASVSAPS